MVFRKNKTAEQEKKNIKGDNEKSNDDEDKNDNEKAKEAEKSSEEEEAKTKTKSDKLEDFEFSPQLLKYLKQIIIKPCKTL